MLSLEIMPLFDGTESDLLMVTLTANSWDNLHLRTQLSISIVVVFVKVQTRIHTDG